jgi:hypothetical protein
MAANEKQIGGNHYKSTMECWDYIVANDLGYLEGTAIKYITRWRKKNGIEDIKKAIHFLEKLVEINSPVPDNPPTFTGAQSTFTGIGVKPMDVYPNNRFYDSLTSPQHYRNSDYPGGIEALEEYMKRVAANKALQEWYDARDV